MKKRSLKNRTFFHAKNPRECKARENVPQKDKSFAWEKQPTSSKIEKSLIQLNWVWNKTGISYPTPFNIVFKNTSWSNRAREGNTRATNKKRKGKIIPIFRWYDSVCQSNSKNFYQRTSRDHKFISGAENTIDMHKSMNLT